MGELAPIAALADAIGDLRIFGVRKFRPKNRKRGGWTCWRGREVASPCLDISGPAMSPRPDWAQYARAQNSRITDLYALSQISAIVAPSCAPGASSSE